MQLVSQSVAGSQPLLLAHFIHYKISFMPQQVEQSRFFPPARGTEGHTYGIDPRCATIQRSEQWRVRDKTAINDKVTGMTYRYTQ